jgi:hypothetical protein
MAAKMNMIQKVNLQPKWDSDTNPPTIGPTTITNMRLGAGMHWQSLDLPGPRNVVIEYREVGIPRSFGNHISERQPPAFVITIGRPRLNESEHE